MSMILGKKIARKRGKLYYIFVKELGHKIKNEVYKRIVYPISMKSYQNMQRQIGGAMGDKQNTFPQAVDRLYKEMNARVHVHPENAETQRVIDNGSGILVGNNQHFGANFLYPQVFTSRGRNDYYFFEKAVAVPYWDAHVTPNILPVFSEGANNKAGISFLHEKIQRSPNLLEI